MKTASVFTGDEECLHHFGTFKVSIKLAQLVKPERVAAFIRIAAQVAEVFHHNKRLVAFRANESFVFNYLLQYRCSRQATTVQPSDKRIAIAIEAVRVTNQGVDISAVCHSVVSRSES